MTPAVASVSPSVSPSGLARPGRLRRLLARRGARFVLGLWTAAAALGVAYVGFRWAGYRVNETPSIPLGVWRFERGARLARGRVAAWCPPDAPAFRFAMARGYLWHDRWAEPVAPCPGGYPPLFKPVAALYPDTVTVTARGLAVNGVALPHTHAFTEDGRGHRLPQLAVGTYVLRPGEVWFVSTYNALSYDARYFGPIPVSHVQGVFRPVFTWGVTR